MVPDQLPPEPGRQRWLLLIHQLPTSNSNLRVRTWRRLQHLGAVAVKQAAYVLPDSPAAREDFQWLRAEIEAEGGESSMFAADAIDGTSDAELVAAFRRARQADYGTLVKAVERESRSRRNSRARKAAAPARDRRRVTSLGQRLAAIERIDFFGSPGRDRAVAALAALEVLTAEPRRAANRDAAGRPPADGEYRGRLWVTRPRPGVDRMASAWLIRRHIDPDARFAFVTDAAAAPPGALPFDMFGVDFSHHGAHCTFETLCERFQIRGAGVERLAAIVHDLDLKDDRFGAPEAATVGLAVDGLQLAHADDAQLLEHGIVLFDAFARSLARVAAPSPPTPKPTRRRM